MQVLRWLTSLEEVVVIATPSERTNSLPRTTAPVYALTYSKRGNFEDLWTTRSRELARNWPHCPGISSLPLRDWCVTNYFTRMRRATIMLLDVNELAPLRQRPYTIDLDLRVTRGVTVLRPPSEDRVGIVDFAAGGEEMYPHAECCYECLFEELAAYRLEMRNLPMTP